MGYNHLDHLVIFDLHLDLHLLELVFHETNLLDNVMHDIVIYDIENLHHLLHVGLGARRIRKKSPNSAAKRDEKTVNAARRSGADIETFRKSNAGTNKAASSGTSLNTKRLDDDTENLTHERVPTELKKAIMQARTDTKLTQFQLAQIINAKPQVIQECESGKAIPNQQFLSKLERALGAKLRGKK